MSDPSDFVIVNGVLKKYVGPGGDVVIPEGVTSIGGWAFCDCSSLTSVTIPDSVTSIGERAFSNCSSLTSVTIPNSVTSIGDLAFARCSSLADSEGFVIVKGILFDYKGPGGDVTVPESVTSIGGAAFYGCKKLTSVMIPEGVTSIGRIAFMGCSGLTSVTIPESVTSIGSSALWGCSSLSSVKIPDSVTSIGKWAFWGCTNLMSIVSNTKLSKDLFDKKPANPLITNDPGMLPANLKPLAAIGFAEQPDDPASERGKKHLKYIKSNASKLIAEALAYPALLGLMCENKLLTPELTEACLDAAQKAGNAEAITVLLDYRQNKLTGKEKAKAAQKAEAREEKVTDFLFSSEAPDRLKGKVFVVTGALKTFTSRDEFKACLDACGAILSETLNEQTDYLVTNTPDSGSAKNKKAEALGVKKLSEAEFNKLIGRKP